MSLPPFHDPEIRKLDFATRAKLIYNYHIEMNKKKHEMQLRYKVYAPWGLPIQASDKFKGSLLKVDENSSSKRRSDRLHKRIEDQTYKENDQDENGHDMPDLDVIENRTSSRKRNLSPNKNSPLSLSHKTPKLDNDQDTQCIQSNKKSKITNNDIIKRSKLFNTPNKRVEKILENAESDIDSMKVMEDEMNLFESTLKELSDGDAESVDNDCDEDLECAITESTFRKRITPPRHGLKKRKGLRVVKENPSNTTKKIKYPKQVTNVEEDDEEPSSTSDNTKNGVPCPLCNKTFPINQIEIHASMCGLAQSNEPVENENDRMIKCETCDNFFPLNTDFEVHVRECLSALKRDSLCF